MPLRRAMAASADRANSPAADAYAPPQQSECRYRPRDRSGRKGIVATGSDADFRQEDATRLETAGSVRLPRPPPAETRRPDRRPGRCSTKPLRRAPAARLRERGRSLPAILRQHLLERNRLDLAAAIGGKAVLGLLGPALVDIRIGLVETRENVVHELEALRRRALARLDTSGFRCAGHRC